VAGGAQASAKVKKRTGDRLVMPAVVGGRGSVLHGKSPPMKAAPDLVDLVDLILASASPRRRELLERMGLALQILPADVDETPRPGERPNDYARRIAAAKCDLIADRLAGALGEGAAPPVVGADTTVIVDDRILGKPTDEADARAMLTLLAGRRHEVTTAYKIRHGDRAVDRAVTTLVAVRALRAAELDAYLACGEWRGKAGGYAVQGIAGAFITELRGSHTNVIGLPLAELLADLQALEALPRYPRPAFGDTAGE
jgi:septum formation protein